MAMGYFSQKPCVHLCASHIRNQTISSTPLFFELKGCHAHSLIGGAGKLLFYV